MATYNRVATLPRAIDSILSQTIEDIELIIVDDGSADSTPELLRKYIDNDNRITVITQKNQGLAIARNNGVSQASGEHIAFMDSDDACAVNRLEIQFDFLKKNPKHSACTLLKLSSIKDYRPGIVANTDDQRYSYSGSAFHNNQKFPCLGAYSFMTRESFVNIGGYRSQNTIIEDLDFTLHYSNHYTWVAINSGGSYYYTYPSDNPEKGLINSDVLTFPKRIVACYISEWCRINNIQDPVEQDQSLEEILAIANRIPIKDRAIIYRNMRYFSRILAEIEGMSNRTSKNYLLGLLGDSILDRWLINFRFKLRG